ncbi:hypothetical protein PENANT_c037G07134 [Penicillium antarcticum]|uniref:N-acetyltransferase domain-containing protein n=1 Tax=Penicillium antarcticum TaxID=416450 RepID=A0A1V6PTJ8_9EURO|nr:hypothetical protein PENANT_c037G07134 [Penicillium antarcticum]
MALKAPLILELATPDDIPAITNLWFTVFNESMNHLMPDTPGVRAWMTEANYHDMENKPYHKYIKIIDPTTKDVDGRPRLAAYAKWDLAMPNQRGPRFPPWHADMPAGDCDAFFGKLEDDRRRVMDLDMLGTHPDYRRCGAGSALVQWGCDIADREGDGAYVDASKAGAPLYERHGFADLSDPAKPGATASMGRL